MSYQIIIGEGVSRPMDRDVAEAWEKILRDFFPRTRIVAIPLFCPQCGHPLPDAGPCWHNLFQEETVTSEELEQALIPGEL